MSFLISLDSSPWSYWMICGLLYIGVIALCFESRSQATALGMKDVGGPAWRGRDLTFIAALSVMLLAFRWPVFFCPYPLNPDESTFVSCTLNLHNDPVFYRSTLGYHLNMYPRMLPGLFGLPQNYLTSRIMALLIVCGSLAVFYRTCRLFAPAAVARLVTLAPATFYALTTERDFVHFSSEHMPILLLCGACYFALRLSEEKKRPNGMAYVAGLLLGAAPFAKNQAAYLALVMTIFCYVFLIRRDDSWSVRLRACLWLTLGGMTVPSLVAAMSLITGTFERFWQGYVVMSLTYAGKGGPWIKRITDIPIFLESAPDFRSYLSVMLGMGIMGISWLVCSRGWKLLKPTHRRLVIFSSVFLVMGIYTALVTGRLYGHYLLFIVFPAALWAFAMFAACLNGSETHQEFPGKSFRVAAVTWSVVALFGQVADYILHPHPHEMRGHVREFAAISKSEIAQEISRYGSPGEPLGLWGWMYDYNVETGMWRAASDMLLEYLWVVPSRGQDLAGSKYLDLIPEYYRKLYIDDIQRSNPPVFIDAVAPGAFVYNDRKLYGYETFPPLAAYINAQYKLVKEINGARIFVRNDRLAQRRIMPPDVAGPDRKKHQDEITRCQHAADARPEDPVAQDELGVALAAAGHLDSALTHFQKSLILLPDQGGVHSRIGSIFMRMGRMESAKIHFEKAIKAAPDEPGALNGLAWILATSPDPHMRNGPRAVALARKVVGQSGGQDPVAIQSLAAALAERGSLTEAIRVAITAMQKASSSGDAALSDRIRNQIEIYIYGEPYRDHLVPEPDVGESPNSNPDHQTQRR